jgi:hypothetical protein
MTSSMPGPMLERLFRHGAARLTAQRRSMPSGSAPIIISASLALTSGSPPSAVDYDRSERDARLGISTDFRDNASSARHPRRPCHRRSMTPRSMTRTFMRSKANLCGLDDRCRDRPMRRAAFPGQHVGHGASRSSSTASTSFMSRASFTRLRWFSISTTP